MVLGVLHMCTMLVLREVRRPMVHLRTMLRVLARTRRIRGREGAELCRRRVSVGGIAVKTGTKLRWHGHWCTIGWHAEAHAEAHETHGGRGVALALPLAVGWRLRVCPTLRGEGVRLAIFALALCVLVASRGEGELRGEGLVEGRVLWVKARVAHGHGHGKASVRICSVGWEHRSRTRATRLGEGRRVGQVPGHIGIGSDCGYRSLRVRRGGIPCWFGVGHGYSRHRGSHDCG